MVKNTLLICNVNFATNRTANESTSKNIRLCACSEKSPHRIITAAISALLIKEHSQANNMEAHLKRDYRMLGTDLYR